MSDVIKQMYDEDGNRAFPVTHVSAVKDSNGTTLPDILDRDYPTTSKTPVEGSTEVSLVTRGEKYDYDKVNNATDVSGASGIGADFKYLLLNGTTGEFEKALESYVNEKVRSAIGSLINNLDKGTGVKAVAGIDNNNDLGTITAANLASLLGGGANWLRNPVGLYINSLDDISPTRVNWANKYDITGQPFPWAEYVAFPQDIVQMGFAISSGQPRLAFRFKYNGDWSAWKEV